MKGTIATGVLIAILCLLSFSAIAQETERLGGVRIAYVEIEEDGTSHIGIENVGYQRQAEGVLNIMIDGELSKPINISIRDRDPGYCNEHQLEFEGSCTLTLTSIDENRKTTSKVVLDYENGTYIYIDLDNIDGYISTSTLRRPSSVNKEVEDWLECWGCSRE